MSNGSARERIRHRRENAVDPEAFLREAGAIQPSDGDEQLEFTPDFAARVRGHLETVRGRGGTDSQSSL